MDILKFLKKNAEAFFSAETVSQCCGVNIQTVNSQLKKLQKQGVLEFREYQPDKGAVGRMYCYRNPDGYLDEALHGLKYLKQTQRLEMWRADDILRLMGLRELKIINRRLENLEEKMKVK